MINNSKGDRERDKAMEKSEGSWEDVKALSFKDHEGRKEGRGTEDQAGDC